MYDIVTESVEVCKDILIPILGTILLMVLISYFIAKKNYYNTKIYIIDQIDKFDKILYEEFEKEGLIEKKDPKITKFKPKEENK